MLNREIILENYLSRFSVTSSGAYLNGILLRSSKFNINEAIEVLFYKK